MSAKLSNKALFVLEVLRHEGELTVNQVADAVEERLPCPACDGTGQGDHLRFGCRRCYGRGRVLFGYSDAYQALKRLLDRGMVTRRHPLDEFGDECNFWVWSAVDAADPSDELEAAFAAPAAEGTLDG